jgi:hypothetical protein
MSHMFEHIARMFKHMPRMFEHIRRMFEHMIVNGNIFAFSTLITITKMSKSKKKRRTVVCPRHTTIRLSIRIINYYLLIINFPVCVCVSVIML